MASAAQVAERSRKANQEPSVACGRPARRGRLASCRPCDAMRARWATLFIPLYPPTPHANTRNPKPLALSSIPLSPKPYTSLELYPPSLRQRHRLCNSPTLRCPLSRPADPEASWLTCKHGYIKTGLGSRVKGSGLQGLGLV